MLTCAVHKKYAPKWIAHSLQLQAHQNVKHIQHHTLCEQRSSCRNRPSEKGISNSGRAKFGLGISLNVTFGSTGLSGNKPAILQSCWDLRMRSF